MHSPIAPGRTQARSRVRPIIALAIASVTVATGVITSNTANAVPSADLASSARPSVTTTEISAEKQVTLEAKTAIIRISAATSAARAAATKEASLRKAVVKLAKAQIGDSYVRGASGPSRFDCSGLVKYVMKNVVGKNLPHSSRAMWGNVKKIKKSEAKPGDLVFFFRNGARHVGIYIGGGKMVDARNPRQDIRVSPINKSWWARSYTGMGRVIPAA